jgi:hypothetical protein
MKKIENKTVKLKSGQELQYFDLIKGSFSTVAVSNGVTIGQMRKDIKILDKVDDLKKPNESFDSEQLTRINQVVSIRSWGVHDIALIEFTDYIKSIDEK